MSRLYVKTDTDAIQTTHTARGHQEVITRIFWGSNSDSKLAVDITVRWDKNTAKPIVQVCAGADINVDLIK